MTTVTIPPHWANLVDHSSELATEEVFNLAETWLTLDAAVDSTNIQGPITSVSAHHKGDNIYDTSGSLDPS